MPYSLVALLALVSSLGATTIDVPYMPQSDALCGGAAAAMVLRYWGEAHAGVADFAPLVDRRAGGIADTALVSALARRGWTVDRFEGSLTLLEAHLGKSEPVIVLLADRGTRYHYVVVVGRTADAVVVHDPSWGPSRAMREADFVKLWRPSGFWSLVVRPGQTIAPGPAVSVEPPDPAKLAAAEQDASLADLAGIRFAQQRWREAVALARSALERDPHDAYALDVLGSSLFMQNDPAGALGAWNQLGKPKLDRVRIEGIHHSRYQAVVEALQLSPGSLVTPDMFERARRRLDDLPDRATARLDMRPDADGFATVDIVIAERSAMPRSTADWAAIGLGAAIDRETVATLPGFTGEGEIWTAAWRFWTNRPRVAFGFAAPRFAGLPGIWRVDASWDSETYASANSSALIREARTHAGIGVSDWLSGRWRYSISGGLDEWSGGRTAGSIGGSLERRLARDRLSIVGEGETWTTHGTVPSFSSAAVRGAWTPSPVIAGWSYAAGGGIQRVSEAAPLGLWPGAGEGHARTELLRAHPMLDDGIVDISGASAFGRTLAYANGEAQRWFDRAWPARFGVAAFADVARATRGFDGRDLPTQIDVGAGLRVRVPGMKRVLRADVAHGIRDGATAFTIGWVY